jgi:hypothetical protein
MNFTRAYIIIGIFGLLLLASCGKQYQAKSLVKDYVKTYAVNPDGIDITSFSTLDSTKVIGDSLIQVMRQRAKDDTMFKNDLQFTAEKKGNTLLYIRMRYGNDSLSMSKTFYFDADMTGIVAFK